MIDNYFLIYSMDSGHIEAVGLTQLPRGDLLHIAAAAEENLKIYQVLFLGFSSIKSDSLVEAWKTADTKVAGSNLHLPLNFLLWGTLQVWRGLGPNIPDNVL